MGPCIFYHFKYDSRNFFLFGEGHESLARDADIINSNPDMTPENTLLFPSFVRSLVIDNPTETFDLMFESLYFLDPDQRPEELITSNSAATNAISNEFFDCIVPQYRQVCMYRTLRVHYVDYRRRGVTHPSTKEEFIENINFLIRTRKIQKQIDAMLPEMRAALYLYINEMLSSAYIESSMTFDSLIMDIYAIARMFRRFDETIDKSPPQFRGTSGNVIYYAGAKHVNNIAQFLIKWTDVQVQDGWIYKPYNDCKSFIELTSEFPHLLH